MTPFPFFIEERRMKNINEITKPVNIQESYLYAIIQRQEVMIEQLSSIIEHIAKKDDVAVTSGTKTRTRAKKE